jgi:5-methylcytosine-specific restriction endonuclease McrA
MSERSVSCQQCGATCIAKNKRKRFCSEKCANAAYYSKNIEKLRAVLLANYHRDRERRLPLMRAYYREHAEEIKQAAMAWMRNHPERMVEINRRAKQRYRKTAKGKMAMRSDRIKRKYREVGRIDSRAWQRKMRRLEGKCQLCGTTDNITVDHILPLKKGGTNHIDNLQPLCRTCNLKKHVKVLPGTQMSLIVPG